MLVVAGERDRPEVNAYADLLAKSIPHARKVVVGGTAHVPNIERLVEFNWIVLEFLDGVGA